MLRTTENTVEQRPDSGARFQAPDLSAGSRAIARGAEGLAQGIGDVESAADHIGKMYDEAAVKQADAEDLKQIAEIRAEALSAKGFDAQSAIGEARTKIEEIRKGRLAGLHNTRQRQMYTDVFDQRNLQIEESFASHSITEIKAAEKGASLARADSYSDLAVDTYGTDAFESNLGTALKEVASVNQGAGAEAIGRQQAKVKSSVYARAISGMIADPDQAEHAQMALEVHAADLLPEDEEKLHRQINPILTENQTAADAGWAYSGSAAPEGQTDNLAPLPDQPKPAPDKVGRPISPADPLRGKGRITDNALEHRERGSGNALDIAAPEGTPIYPPMSGKVAGEPFWTNRGGWQVLIEHPNGYVTGYAHMRSKPALHAGQQVDANSVIGSVGQTGDATGPHVHYTVRASRGGPKVDPEAATWGSTGTVKPESVAWKEGPLQKYEAEQNNLGTALTRLHERATTENWSPQRYQRAVDKVRSINGVQEQLHSDAQTAQYNEALSTVVQLGDKFTSISQVKNFGLLDPSHQYSLQNIAQANAKALADGGVKTNGDRFLTLIGMAQSPQYRGQFLNVDLMKETGITPGERSRLWNTQLELKNEPQGKLASSMDQANSYANRYLPTKDFDKTKRQLFTDRWAATVERQQGELKRELTPREKDDIARSLTVEVVRDGGAHYGFEGTGGQLDIPSTFNNIAPDIRMNIARQLASQGKPSSPRAVVEEWLRSRSR